MQLQLPSTVSLCLNSHGEARNIPEQEVEKGTGSPHGCLVLTGCELGGQAAEENW